MDSQEFRSWQSFESCFRSLPWKQGGHPLSNSDKWRVANAMVLWAQALRDLTHEQRMVASGLQRSLSKAGLSTWIRRLSNYDLDQLVDQLKLALAILRDSHAENDMQFKSKSARKRMRKALSLSGKTVDTVFLGPIWDLVCQYQHTQSCDDYVIANTACQFLVRLTLNDLYWLEESAVADYLAFEEQLKSQKYDDKLLADLNRIIKGWLADMSLDDIRPRHSSGATANTRRGEGLEAKAHNSADPTWSVRQLCQRLGEYPVFRNGAEYALELNPRSEERYSVFAQVAKGLNKKRGISMEDETSQYYQNAIFDAFDNHFKKHPEIHVNLHDQETSRELCLYGTSFYSISSNVEKHHVTTLGRDVFRGSLSRELYEQFGYNKTNFTHISLGTYDLSAASDSVTWTLVKSIFRGTKILPIMWRARTRTVCYRGFEKGKLKVPPFAITAEKFAPMGSSMCFPVESIVFSAAAALAAERTGSAPIWRVYGDDCIVNQSMAQEFVSILEDLHFVVNKDKSYAPGSPFLEACGIETLRGHDVSPTRIPRRFDIVGICKDQSANSMVGAVEFMHTLRHAGLTTSAHYLRHILIRTFGVPCRSENQDDNEWEFQNIPAKLRYNRNTQCMEEQVLAASVHQAQGSDEFRYQTCLLRYSTTERKSLFCFEDRIDTFVGATERSKLQKKWVLCQDQELAWNYWINGCRTRNRIRCFSKRPLRSDSKANTD